MLVLGQEGTNSGTSFESMMKFLTTPAPGLCHSLLESSDVPVVNLALLRFKLLDVKSILEIEPDSDTQT